MREVRALEVAPEGVDRARRRPRLAQLGPDRVRHGPEQLRRRERLAWPRAQLVRDEAVHPHRVEEVLQQERLDEPDHLQDRVVHRQLEPGHAPVRPAVGRELREQLGLEAERVLGERALDDRADRLTLPRRRDGRERRERVRVALVCPRDVQPADLLGHREQRPVTLEDQRGHCIAQPLEALPGRDEPCLEPRLEPLHQRGAVPSEAHRVRAQVPCVRERVDGERTQPVVLVRAVRVQRVRRLPRDLLQADQLRLRRRRQSAGKRKRCIRRLLVDGRVRVLNRPHVVRADGLVPVVSLPPAFRRDVDRAVVHHRERHAVPRGERRVLEPLVRDPGRALEVVSEPERVTDLVHREIADRVAEVLLGDRVARRDGPAGREQRVLQPELLRHAEAGEAEAVQRVAGGGQLPAVQRAHAAQHVGPGELPVLLGPEADDAGGDQHVGVEDLARARVGL